MKLTGAIASVGEISSEGVGLVRGLPHRRRAVVVVRVHVVVVHVHAGQQRTPVKCHIDTSTFKTSSLIDVTGDQKSGVYIPKTANNR